MKIIQRRTVVGVALVLAAVLAGLGLIWPVIGMSAMDRIVSTNDRPGAAAQRVRPALEKDLSKLGLRFGAPLFVRIFKQERELELWLQSSKGNFTLFRTYPICTYSGGLGPKVKQGDNQAPEGFYTVAPAQLNPVSRFHLAFNLGYPNDYDRAHNRKGDFLMVHGNCVSIGCYAMGDAQIEEIYTLAAAALSGGQKQFAVHAFPFRLEPGALAAHRDSPWHEFWTELAVGYAFFEHERVPPQIRVRDGHYSVAADKP